MNGQCSSGASCGRERNFTTDASHQRFRRGEGAEVDAVAASAGEFLVEDVGEGGGVGGDEVAREAAVLRARGEVQLFGARGMIDGDADVVVDEDDVRMDVQGLPELRGDVRLGVVEAMPIGDFVAASTRAVRGPAPAEQRANEPRKAGAVAARAGAPADGEAGQGARCAVGGANIRATAWRVAAGDPVQVAEHVRLAANAELSSRARRARRRLAARVVDAVVEDESLDPGRDFGVDLPGIAVPPEGERRL